MGDTFIDATQSYENETTSMEITNVDNDDLLTPPPSSDANYLIKLVNNASTNTNNLYILQANTNGEIRFLTKEAYLNNDVSANDGNLYYNAKIGKDGKLYLYWTYNAITNPIYFSGWKDIMADVAQGFRDVNLLEAAVFVLEGQVASLIGNVATIDGIVAGHTTLLTTHTSQIAVLDLALADLTTIVVNMASMKSFTHQGWSGWKRRGNVKDAWSRMSDRYNFAPSSTSATGITTAGELFSLGGNTGAEVATIAGLTSRVASEGGSAVNIALSASKKFFDGLNYAFIGAGIVGAITAIAYTYDKQGAQSDEIALPFLYDVRAGLYNDSLKASNDPTKKTLLPYLIHKNGLTILATTNNGFTTAGIYEYSGNASYPEMTINIRISAGLVAEIVAVANSGTKVWAVGNSIIIPKSSIGGTTGNLQIDVGIIYTATEVVDLQIAETQTRIENRDKKMKRRSNVVNYDDIDTAVFTNTTATQAYTEYWDTQETLTYKILKSRINLLPTGTNDVDLYTSTGKVGIGTTPATKLHTYHATDNILRLETGTTGTNSIEFRRGTANDIFTDYRLISSTGVFRLQYENDLLAYGASGTELITSTSTLTTIFKNTSFSGNVGINAQPHSTYKLDVAGDINISTGSLFRINGSEFKPSTATLADTATDLATGSILGTGKGGTGASSHTAGNLILGNGSGALTSASGLNYVSGTTTFNAPNVNVPTGGKYKINNVNLALSDLTGTLAVGSGGTGAATFTANGLIVGNGTSALTQPTGLTFSGTTLNAPIMNVPTGGKYKINNVDLSYNDLTNKLTAGTNITINPANNEISATGGGLSYTAGNGITITGASIAVSGVITQLLTTGSIDMFILQNNATNSLRFKQNFIGTNDFTYNVIQKNNNVDYPAFTFKNGQVAVGTTNVPTYALDVAGDINITGEIRKLSALYKPAGAVLADTASDLATGVILSVAKGGTGANTFTAGRLMVGNGTSALQTYTGLTYTSGTTTLNTPIIAVSGTSTLTGNVGIGTAPSAVATTKLDVLGDVNIVGKTTHKGSIECTTLSPAAPTIPAALSIIPTPLFTFTPASTITRCAVLTFQGVGTGTTYQVVIPEGGMLCDILMVAGGGSGGKDIGAGGGGGAVLYATNVLLKQDTYMMTVGRGAIDGSGEARGQSTTGFGATLLGGGTAGSATWNGATYPNDGGSGAGGKSLPDEWSRRGGRPVVGGSVKGGILSDGTLYEGSAGGYGVVQNNNQVVSGGGGGAGAVGGNGQTSTTTGGSAVGSSGGAGVSNTILDATYFWGGGGGAGSYQYTTAANGGAGGGGAATNNNGGGITSTGSNGASSWFAVGTITNGINGTGGGGGGTGYTTQTAGSGGAGVIIIRYKLPVNNNQTVDFLPTGTNANTIFKQGMVGANYKIQASVSSIVVDAFTVDPSTATTCIKNCGIVVKSVSNDTLISNNCGIGIDPSSTYKLNVNGNININGNIFQNGFSVNAGFQQYRTFNFTYSGDTNFLLTTRARYCNIVCWVSSGSGMIVSNGANMAVNEFRGSLGFSMTQSNATSYFFYWTMQGDTPRPFKAWFGNGSNTTFTFIEMWYN